MIENADVAVVKVTEENDAHDESGDAKPMLGLQLSRLVIPRGYLRRPGVIRTLYVHVAHPRLSDRDQMMNSGSRGQPWAERWRVV
jgi:hypothetical protein